MTRYMHMRLLFGDDIDAACGQLAGRVNDRTRVRLGDKLAAAMNA